MDDNDKTKEQLIEELQNLKREMSLMEKYRTIFENVPDAYYEAAIDGTLLEISDSIEAISKGQYSREEMIGKPFEDVYENPDDRGKFFSELLKKGKLTDYELMLKNKDGSIVPVAISSTVINHPDGKPAKIIGMLRDITERKQAEKEHIENQKVFRVLNELMSDYIFKLTVQSDGSLQMSVIAGNYTAATGRLVGEIDTPANWYKTIHPEDLNKLYGKLNQVLEQKKPVETECRSFTEDGKLRWLEIAASPETDVLTNQVTAIYGSVRNITERKESEGVMKKLSQIVEQSPVSIVITNLDGSIEYANPKACETTGYTIEELLGNNPRVLKSGETSVCDYEGLWKTIYAGKQWNGIFHNVKKTGELYWEAATIRPIVDANGKTTHYLAIKEEITERKQAEEDLKQREEDLNYSQEIAKMGSWELDLITNKIKWSKNYYHLVGLNPSAKIDLAGYFAKMVHPDDLHLLDEGQKEINQTKKATSFDMRLFMPDGAIKWVQNNIVPIFNADKLIHLKGVNIDITDKKIAEEKITQQNERLNAIISAMPDLIFVIDKEGTYCEFYSSDTESLIVPVNQIVGTNLSSVFDESSARAHLENINKCIDEKRLITYEYSIPKSDSIGYYEARLAPLGADKVLTSVRDITIRKETEFEIRDLNQNLELRIEKRTAQLAETNENLQLEIGERIKTSTALKEALERLHKIADRIPGAVYQFRLRTDGTYCFPYVSEGINNILKITSEAAVKDASIVFSQIHPDDLAPLIASIFASAREMSFWQYEYRVLSDDGAEHWLGGNSMPQLEDDGSVLWHGYISDITDRKQTEQNLKWNQSLLNLMSNSSPLGFLVVDNRTDDILYFNERFVQIWGIEQLSEQMLRGELKNNDIIPYCLPILADIPAFVESCKPLQLEENRIIIEDEIAFTGNRTVRRFSTQIRGTNDEYYGRFYIFEDISERKRAVEALKESENRFSSFMDYLPAIVFLKDHEGRTLFVNRYMDNAFGASAWVGKTMLEVFPNELGAKLVANDLNSIAMGYLKIEESITQIDGKLRDYETQKFTIDRQGHQPWLGGISLDITERKQAEAEIIKARHEAEKANQAKSEFLSRMSHELRTPMNSILGFAQLLQMGELNSRQQAGVGHILSSGKHLLNLINEVLDIARIESGKVPILHEPVQIQDIIIEMIDLVNPAIQKQQLTLEFIDSPVNQLFVISDRQRLRQVLLNLINNAIKYNSTKGTVTIKTGLRTIVEDGVSLIRISITDTGLGISPEDQYKLFKPFERIGAEKTETEGTGLGLAVVKKLMDAMDGYVGVKSNLGAGSTFWIELPQSTAQSEHVEIKGGIPAITSKVDDKVGTILYIEDNQSNVDLVAQILTALRPDIRLISNKNGRLAVPLAIEHSPDLILLDLDLPDIHGVEVLGILKRKESVSQIPVVIISADAMPQQLENVMKAGAINYLTKPLDIEIFLSVVDEWIGKGK